MARGLVPVWERTAVSSAGRDAHVLFVCFASLALREDVKFAVDRFGVSSIESLRAVDVREHAREANPDWFDGWRSGALRQIAERDLHADLAALDAADRCITLEIGVADPTDLAHLQSVWALARWFFARGANVALDVHAARFLRAADLPAPSSQFDVHENVSTIFETDATEPDGRHVLHTRGMRKFGRPDIVRICAPDDVDRAAEVLGQLASGMALGFMPALPRHGVDVSPEASWYLVADEDEAYSRRLGLGNDARLLV